MNNSSDLINKVEVSAYRIPTDKPESDGTMEWDSTTLVIVRIWCGNESGLGYTYSDKSIVSIIKDVYEPLLLNKDPDRINELWMQLHNTMRNLGDIGLTSTAVAAVDNALWDLRARIYKIPLVKMLGQVRDKVEGYGSGGFTSYSNDQLQAQLSMWLREGFKSVKIKIGRDKLLDQERIPFARMVIGEDVDLLVDGNGAYSPKEACKLEEVLNDNFVSWFEEPVNHMDRQGLSFVRRHLKSQRICAGEYGYTSDYFKDLLVDDCIDVLQADATRCGTTGFLNVASFCEAFHIPLSAHTAPSLHTHICCSVIPAMNVEYFHDHVRIEQKYFDGAVRPQDGWLVPDMSSYGNGLEFKYNDAESWRVG